VSCNERGVMISSTAERVQVTAADNGGLALCFNVLFKQLRGGTEESHGNMSDYLACWR
jgi:hypothetical protein